MTRKNSRPPSVRDRENKREAEERYAAEEMLGMHAGACHLRDSLCGNQPVSWDVGAKLQNSLSRSNRSRFGWFLDGSIALVEFSKHNERFRRNPFNYAHIEVGLKI